MTTIRVIFEGVERIARPYYNYPFQRDLYAIDLDGRQAIRSITQLAVVKEANDEQIQRQD